MTACVRVGDLKLDGVDPGDVYVLASSVRAHMSYLDRDLLHVMSKHRGGEIRGYERPLGSDKPWSVRPPHYEGHWPEVDQAVADLTGEAIMGLDGAVVRRAA